MKYIALLVSIIAGFFCIASIPYLLHIRTIEYSIPIVIYGTQEYEDAFYELIGNSFSIVLLFLIFYIVSTYTYSLYHKLSRRRKIETLSSYADIKSPFVLYLRSFMADDETKKTLSFSKDYRSEEELLIDSISDIAPIYAIGNPLDKKLPHGAIRIYVSDEKWKETVQHLAERAELVVLRLGMTNNFWWEVEMALKTVPLDKLLFLIPSSKKSDNVSLFHNMMLMHGVDVSKLQVSHNKKSRGSISSIVWFDNNTPQVTEVVIPKFTSFVVSYEQLLKNALVGIRRKYGLSVSKKRSYKWARVGQLVLFFYILFNGWICFYKDYTALRNQLPYELNEECIKSESFVSKYSNDINGYNLGKCVVESAKGRFALSDDEYMYLWYVEYKTIAKASISEKTAIYEHYWRNLLLMIKKYYPEDYKRYVSILYDAAILSIDNHYEIEEIIGMYQNQVEYLPEWVIQFFDTYTEDSLDTEIHWREVVMDHVNDDYIAEVLKTIYSLSITI